MLNLQTEMQESSSFRSKCDRQLGQVILVASASEHLDHQFDVGFYAKII